MYQLLSYTIKPQEPTWPGSPTVEVTKNSSIADGDTANTCMIHLFNHYGTHFDAPLHFCENGKPLAELDISRFLFQSPFLIDLPKQPGEKIEPENLVPFEPQIKSCDLLLIRTGFWKVRMENPSVYEQNGPAVSSCTARYLMDHYPNLKALALDFVSLASYSDQADGNLAHQYLLGKFHDSFICIIEDVNMADLPLNGIKSAAAIPLFIEGIDSCPVTMWAELEGR